MKIPAAAVVVLFLGSPEDGRLQGPQLFKNGLVVSESELASQVGKTILQQGGNAVDAAVATTFALAVTFPTAGNIGGGGFLLVRFPDGSVTAFDFREKAPLASTEKMFLDEKGTYDPKRHHWSILSVGVPGTVAGLHLAHQRLGKLPWKDLVQPAVDLARNGFRVSAGLARSLKAVLPFMKMYPASLAQFSKNGEPYREGDLLVQEDLGRTLEGIRDEGPRGFYEGETARLLVQEMERQGGLISHEDLKAYGAMERKPLRGTYRGFEVFGMPPPSSGGVALIELLNILEGFDLKELGFRSAKGSHLLIEAMRRAYADRARYLGDPDGVRMPVEKLISKEYAADLRKTIQSDRASVSSPESFEWPVEGTETTHISAADRNLMAVSLTTTLEQGYGSRIVVPGAGFLLNNEMGDFNPVPGLTTRTGLIGTPPNLVAPGKRMLSSMTPTIVCRNGKLYLVLGSPGGRTIINTVVQVLINLIDHGLPVQEAVGAPRFHHQWLPDRVRAENDCFTEEIWKALEGMGHKIEEAKFKQGSVMAIRVHAPEEEGERVRLEAGVDHRRSGCAAAGY